MDKNAERRKIVLFGVAALFALARNVKSENWSPKESFDDADEFLKEAEARGIDVTVMMDAQ